MSTTPNRPTRRAGSHFGAGASGTERPAAARPAPPRGPREGGRGTSGVTTRRISGRAAQATRRARGARPSAPARARRIPASAGRDPRRVALLAGCALLVLAAVVAAVVVLPRALGKGPGHDRPAVAAGTQVSVQIPDGSGAGAIAKALYDAGVIDDTGEFLSMAKRTNSEQALKSGSYVLVAGDDLGTIIDQLKAGPNDRSGVVTIPEGFTVAQVAQAVERSLGIPVADFLAQAKASNYSDEFAFLAGVPEDSLEGYLFPKTYDFSGRDVTADDVIRAMLSQFADEVAALDLDAALQAVSSRYGIDADLHDVVTMASIIEREASADDQRADVASVFYNRLSQGMRLQSDATLVYALGREVTPDDLKKDAPYNTYTREGLTPTPICSPGLGSLRAAAHPNDTRYLYFFIQGDYARFSETYEQHEQAIDQRPRS